LIKESIYIKEIRDYDTYPLRSSLLRDNQMKDVPYPNDKALTTFHLGAFFYGQLIGIASIYYEAHNSLNIPLVNHAYRLRGMAVDKEYRNMDVGKKLVNNAETRILESCDKALLWCNARELAIGFYKKLDFEEHGEFFDIEGIGVHKIMYKIATI